MDNFSKMLAQIERTKEMIKDTPIEEEYQELFQQIVNFSSNPILQNRENMKKIYNHTLFKEFQKKHPFNKELGKFSKISCYILVENNSSKE